MIDAWLAAACADAERRGLPELKPLLESLARSTAALRAADARARRRATSRRADPRPIDAATTRHEPGSPPDRRRRAPGAIRCALARRRSCRPASPQIDARPELNAFITRLDAQALADADAVRSGRFAPGTTAGPLHGIPISVKDLIDVAGAKTTSGSAQPAVDGDVGRARRSRGCRRPAPSSSARRTSTSSRSARRARSPPSAPCAIRTTRRDRPADRAAAPPPRSRRACASARSAPTPADRSASRRPPAARSASRRRSARSACDGVVPLSTTLDHLGPMARSVADVALLFAVLTGRPPRASPRRPPTAERVVFGVPRPYFCDRIDPGVRQALERTCAALDRGGPHGPRRRGRARRRGRRTSTSTSSCPRRRGITRAILERSPALYSPGVRVRLEMGRYLLAEDYVRAMRPEAGADGARSTARSTRATRCSCRRSRFRRRRSGPRRSTSTARPSRSARRCCGSRSSSTSPATRRSRCRRRRTSTRCHGACRSSDGATRPIASCWPIAGAVERLPAADRCALAE